MLANDRVRLLAGALMTIIACALLSCGERSAIDEHPAETDASGATEASGEPAAPEASATPDEPAGATDAGAAPDTPAPAASDDLLARGREVYNAHCLICHQYDGSGVANFQPSLVDSEVVAAADPDALIRTVVYGVGVGPKAMQPSGDYSGVMNAFGHLPDEDLAALISFVRMEWGGAEEPVTVEDIERVRAASAE